VARRWAIHAGRACLTIGHIDLLAFAQDEQFHAALLLSTGWGLVFLFLIAGPW
jgi:hypothetical protein